MVASALLRQTDDGKDALAVMVLQDNSATGSLGVRAIRHDADTPSVNDLDTSPLHTNSKGRLKVASTPADYDPVTGNIVNATSTVAMDVSKASNVVFAVTGTFTGVNLTFEGSIDGGTNWFQIQAARSNANTIESVSGVIATGLTYSWEASVNAYTNFRVRATAWTSGTAVVRILAGAYATEPAPAIQTHAVTVSSGNITNTTVAPTASSLALAATTNATAIKTSAGTLFEVSISNITAATIWVKFYNKASAPTVGSDIPVMTIPVAAGAFFVAQFGALGKRFSTGIALAATANSATSDTTAITAGALVSSTYI